jgi:hypothetical protein
MSTALEDYKKNGKEFFIVLIICGFAFYLFVLFVDWTIPQKNYFKENNIALSDANSFMDGACHDKTVCEKYSEVLRGCASAGNIDRCISIRMESEDISRCNDDGSLSYIDRKIVPFGPKCLFIRYVAKTHQKS